MIRTTARRMALCSLVAITLTVAGCSGHDLQYEDNGKSYSIEDLDALVDEAPRPSAMGSPVDEASELRQEALVELRTRGESAEELARFLTDLFPNEEESVPYYAELAVVDGADVWVVLEVWGSAGGMLERTRMWVFDADDGSIVRSASFN